MLRKAAFLFIIAALLLGLIPCANAAPVSLEGRIVILDAGHSDGYNTYAGYSEGTTMLVLARKIKTLLEERGAEVFLTRDGPDTVELPQRAALINKLALEAIRGSRIEKLAADAGDPEIAEIDRLTAVMQSVIDDPERNGSIYMNSPYDYSLKRTIHPDLQAIFELENDPVIREKFLVISLHSNATAPPVTTSISGADVYYCSNTFSQNANYYKNYTYCDLEIYFGNLILDKIDELGISKRKIIENNWFITREHNVPGVLIENGYHTNGKDRAKLSDDTFLNELAAAYADAISVYYDHASPRAAAAPEPDPNAAAWYDDAYSFVTQNNLLPDDVNAAFSPDAEIDAAAFAGLLTNFARYINPPQTGSTEWHPPDGLIKNPQTAITREEAALIIYDYLRSRNTALPAETVSFSDTESISETAREAVTAMLAYGVMVGCTEGFFYPDRTITQAEAAQVCLNLSQEL